MTRLRFLLVSLFSAVGAALGLRRRDRSQEQIAIGFDPAFGPDQSVLCLVRLDDDYLRVRAWRDGNLVWETWHSLLGKSSDDRVALECTVKRDALDWAKCRDIGNHAVVDFDAKTRRCSFVPASAWT